MAIECYIHAGAHRTGTSSFQACLALNRPALEAAGHALAYPGRDGAEGGRLALRLPHPRHRRSPDDAWVEGARTELQRHIREGVQSFVLSEENVPGRMFHFYHGQFYPTARRRAEILRRALPGPVTHLVFVIRPYAALFTSAYRKRAEDNAVAPFAEISENMAGMERGWPELLTILRRRLRPGRMTVIEYGARGESRDLLARLLPGVAAGELDEPEQQVNLSATDAALEVLQARYRGGETLPRSEWQAVIAAHAEARDDRGFAAFTPEQQARLADRYARDLERIAVMRDITFIG